MRCAVPKILPFIFFTNFVDVLLVWVPQVLVPCTTTPVLCNPHLFLFNIIHMDFE